MQAYGDAVRTVINSLLPLVDRIACVKDDEDPWVYISKKCVITFWLFSIEDLKCPTDIYTKHIEKNEKALQKYSKGSTDAKKIQ